jgi:hypothetical protein
MLLNSAQNKGTAVFNVLAVRTPLLNLIRSCFLLDHIGAIRRGYNLSRAISRIDKQDGRKIQFRTVRQLNAFSSSIKSIRIKGTRSCPDFIAATISYGGCPGKGITASNPFSR